MHSFYFFLITFFGTTGLRKLGWYFSRRFLYSVSPLAAGSFGFLWGGMIASLVHILIGALHPFWLIEWIFGYAQGAYASVPNYGLLSETTIPTYARLQHNLISSVPLVSYILTVIVLDVVRPVQ